MARVGLLGTRFTMEGDFYKGRLVQKYGIDVVIPTERQRQTVHDIIYDELCRGEVRLLSKQFFKKVIEDLVARGAQGIILGCTEIPMLVKQEDSPVPLFDTTMIHAKSAVEYALNE
jgi:aspartate racemase